MLFDKADNASFFFFCQIGINYWLYFFVRLNYSIMDGCKWTACLHPEEAASGVTTNNDYTRYELGLQISCHLADLKRQMWMKKVHTEDLEWLHHSLMHLEAHPASKEEVSDSN